jgi:hypothetical protein
MGTNCQTTKRHLESGAGVVLGDKPGAELERPAVSRAGPAHSDRRETGTPKILDQGKGPGRQYLQ